MAPRAYGAPFACSPLHQSAAGVHDHSCSRNAAAGRGSYCALPVRTSPAALESRASVNLGHERLLLQRRSDVGVLGARGQLDRDRGEVLVFDQ